MAQNYGEDFRKNLEFCLFAFNSLEQNRLEINEETLISQGLWFDDKGGTRTWDKDIILPVSVVRKEWEKIRERDEYYMETIKGYAGLTNYTVYDEVDSSLEKLHPTRIKNKIIDFVLKKLSNKIYYKSKLRCLDKATKNLFIAIDMAKKLYKLENLQPVNPKEEIKKEVPIAPQIVPIEGVKEERREEPKLVVGIKKLPDLNETFEKMGENVTNLWGVLEKYIELGIDNVSSVYPDPQHKIHEYVGLLEALKKTFSGMYKQDEYLEERSRTYLTEIINGIRNIHLSKRKEAEAK